MWGAMRVHRAPGSGSPQSPNVGCAVRKWSVGEAPKHGRPTALYSPNAYGRNADIINLGKRAAAELVLKAHCIDGARHPPPQLRSCMHVEELGALHYSKKSAEVGSAPGAPVERTKDTQLQVTALNLTNMEPRRGPLKQSSRTLSDWSPSSDGAGWFCVAWSSSAKKERLTTVNSHRRGRARQLGG